MTTIIEAEIDPEITEFQKQYASEAYDREYAQVERERQAAYQAEADPIFFQAQRGKRTEQEWLDKIAEIDARLPYPVKETGKK